jgi:hypothetical protein
VPHEITSVTPDVGPVNHLLFHVGKVDCFRVIEHMTCRPLIVTIVQDQVVGGGGGGAEI